MADPAEKHTSALDVAAYPREKSTSNAYDRESHESEVAENLELSPQEERRLLRRIDIAIVPYASLLYLLNFLDRTAISQARLAGLEKDLKLVGNQYAIALSIFFLSYVGFEVPSNLLIRRLRPKRWICFIMVAWSLCQIFMGFVHNAQGLYITRFFLGMFESGLVPGLNFLMTCWYTREEQNFRISVFFAGATLAGAFGGLLAFGIRHMQGVGNKGGWAWIFILEGILTLLCVLPAWWLIVDFPHDSKLLNAQERAKWLHRLNKSQGVTNAPLPFTKRQVVQGLSSWRTYIYGLIYLGLGQTFYSTAFFIPTIIAGLGFTNAQANLLSAAPFGFGTIVTISVGIITDRYAIRGPIIIILSFITISGLIILLSDVAVGVKYFAVFLAMTGVYAGGPTTITWIGINCGPMYTRAAAMGVFFTMGNSAGIIASNVYPASEGPKYVKGNSIALAFACMATILTAFLSYDLRRENKRRDKLYGVPAADGSECSPLRAGDPALQKKFGLQGMTETQIIELGDKHPAFRYIW